MGHLLKRLGSFQILSSLAVDCNPLEHFKLIPLPVWAAVRTNRPT
jgi:hypothetical protein